MNKKKIINQVTSLKIILYIVLLLMKIKYKKGSVIMRLSRKD